MAAPTLESPMRHHAAARFVARAATCLLLAATAVDAQRLPDAQLRTPADSQQRQDMRPPGFVWEQMRAGARWGSIGALAGLLAGSALVGQSDGELDALGYPIAGAMLGYLVGAPLGVYRYSESQGVRAPFLASAGGALIGSVGIAGFGVAFFVTVPLGAAWMHNKASR